MTKVCRLCLQRLARGAKYFNINAVESFSGFMPYRDQLTTCIPEMALDLIPNPVVCNTCRLALRAAYDFKTRCMLVEKRIRTYIEQQPANVNNYDLSHIEISDLPPVNKVHLLHTELEQDEILDNNDNCQIFIPKSSGSVPISEEVEITKISKKKSMRMKESAHYCFKCWKKFDDVADLIAHKSDHSEDFVCNFCSESFNSLQALRRHNTVCSKGNNKGPKTNILTKRPHLPTKAKNYLKRWLFRHTDHPYPTDLEKQMLMQQTKLSLLQVENWFINARRRILHDLTKLKKRGIKCEDMSDSDSNGLHFDLEEITRPYEEILVKSAEFYGSRDVENAIEAVAIIKTNISAKNDQEESIIDPLDISVVKTEIKTEIDDDR